MKSLLITLAATLASGHVIQICAQGTVAPLSLLINGDGSVSPLTNGEPLQVGQTYHITATPRAGFVFNNWQPVNVFTTTTFVINTDGSTNEVASTTVSPLPVYTNQPSLDFIMEPVVVILDNPGVLTITKASGWQVNFGAIAINIQLNGSTSILTWTNSSLTLQAAPAPVGPYTNISAAISPYTNKISWPVKYFRLMGRSG